MRAIDWHSSQSPTLKRVGHPRPKPACIFILACIACVSAAPAAKQIDFANPPQGVLFDDWMIVEIMGNKIGYSHSEIARNGDVIESYNLMSMSLKRVGSPVTINVLQTTRETIAGIPLDFTSQMDAAAQMLQTRGVIKDGKVRVTSKQFGAPTSNEHNFPVGAVMTWGTLLKQHKMGYAPGTKYSLDIYDPSSSIAIRTDVEIHGPERIEIEGKAIDAIRSTQILKMGNAPTGMKTTAWVDKNGTILRTSLNLMGMPMVMTRTTKEKALLEFSPPEFFMPTTIKIDQPIDRRAKRIDYVLQLRDKSVDMPSLPRTAMQTPKSKTSHSVRLTVKRIDHTALRAVPAGKYGDEYRKYLAPNPIVNSNDPAVKEMAERARGDAVKPYDVADNLRKYVTDVIREKNLDVGFASASEVCRNKEGDCSEHAVLLAALGRACDIPTQVVTGIVYVPVFGGDTNIFGFHMWTQFLIGDQWVDFDAAQRESDCNPTHIAFHVTSLYDAGLGQIAFGLIPVIGNLEVKIEHIEPASEESSSPTSRPARQGD